MKLRIITALILAPLGILGILYLPFALFMSALAVVTLLGFWEWTQFVNQPSPMLAMIPALLVGGTSVALIDFQFPAISNMNTAHLIVLGIGSLWWIVSGGLAITYPRSRPLWEHSSTVRHLFALFTLLCSLECVVLTRRYSPFRSSLWCEICSLCLFSGLGRRQRFLF